MQNIVSKDVFNNRNSKKEFEEWLFSHLELLNT